MCKTSKFNNNNKKVQESNDLLKHKKQMKTIKSNTAQKSHLDGTSDSPTNLRRKSSQQAVLLSRLKFQKLKSNRENILLALSYGGGIPS